LELNVKRLSGCFLAEKLLIVTVYQRPLCFILTRDGTYVLLFTVTYISWMLRFWFCATRCTS
jgi:hypothetical protein